MDAAALTVDSLGYRKVGRVALIIAGSKVMLAILEWSAKHDAETFVPSEFAEKLRSEFFGDPDEMLTTFEQINAAG